MRNISALVSYSGGAALLRQHLPRNSFGTSRAILCSPVFVNLNVVNERTYDDTHDVRAASVALVSVLPATISSSSVIASTVPLGPPSFPRTLNTLCAGLSMLTGDGGRWGVVFRCTGAVLCWKFQDDEFGGGGGACRRCNVCP